MEIWHTLVLEGARGRIDGFLGSVAHPGSNLLGPGVIRLHGLTAEGVAEPVHAEQQHGQRQADEEVQPDSLASSDQTAFPPRRSVA